MTGKKTSSAPAAAGHDFIRAMVARDIATGKHGGRVVTRFPPEPNGFLHIGHAKSICLNFGVAAEFGGRCHLRFDDTNPETEDIAYVDAIRADVAWLGFDWGEHLYFASDYFEAMYHSGEHLIRQGLAYVDSASEEEIRTHRGTVTQPGTPTRDRARTVAENLDLFRRMRAGEFPDGAHVLRARIDLAAPNMLMRDPVLYRIRHAHHYRQGDAWPIYPLYDYAHPIEDALESVTHSLCTLEFENNRELYDWVVDHLPRTGAHAVAPGARPEQTEFARLSLDYTVMSKRKLLQLVQDGQVGGWDDPRLPTIAGLRRRGVTPEAIRSFCDMIGVARANTRVDIAKLEYAIRDDLNYRAPRVLCVLDPLRVVITSWPEDRIDWIDAPLWPHDVPHQGTRRLPFTREILIERDDFMEAPPRNFFRLAPGREVRLRYGYIIRCDEVVKDGAGRVVELRCSHDAASSGGAAADGRTVKGTLHWVSASYGLPCRVNLYDRLFRVPDPDAAAGETGDFRDFLNPDSLVQREHARIEPAVHEIRPGTHFQFERLGYFCVDAAAGTPGAAADTAAGLTFNRTVTLRDTWARLAAGADPQVSPGRPDRSRKGRPAPAAAAPRAAGAEVVRSGALKAARRRLRDDAGLSEEAADVLTRDAHIVGLFEDALRSHGDAEEIARWLLNEMPREARERAAELTVTGAQIGRLLALLAAGQVTGTGAREVFAEMLDQGDDPERIIERRGLRPLDTASIGPIVDAVLAEHAARVKAYHGGKTGLLGFFIGQVMARAGGRADAEQVREQVHARLH